MKRLLTVLLCITILLASNISFAEPSLWAKEEVERADEWGLIPERLKGDYLRDITREEFSELVINLYESIVGKTLEEVYESPFIDTDNQSVLKAYRLGIINGIGDSKFAPGSLVNREQIATMLYRMLKSLDTNIVNGYHEFTFTDKLNTSEWAIAPISFLNDSSIIRGYADNEFKPKNNTSIEQSIAMVARIYDFLGATVTGEESDEYYLDDGSRYIGEMTDGYPHGLGVLYMPSGDIY